MGEAPKGFVGNDIKCHQSDGGAVRAASSTGTIFYAASDDLKLREFRLPEFSQSPCHYGESESHQGAVTVLCAHGPHLYTGSSDSVIKVINSPTHSHAGALTSW